MLLEELFFIVLFVFSMHLVQIFFFGILLFCYGTQYCNEKNFYQRIFFLFIHLNIVLRIFFCNVFFFYFMYTIQYGIVGFSMHYWGKLFHILCVQFYCIFFLYMICQQTTNNNKKISNYWPKRWAMHSSSLGHFPFCKIKRICTRLNGLSDIVR